MNEKTKSIFVRVTPQEKKRMEQYAARCKLSLSEYIRKRALGFVPRAVQPDAFYDFCRKLDAILALPLNPETEARVLELMDSIHTEFIAPGRDKGV